MNPQTPMLRGRGRGRGVPMLPQSTDGGEMNSHFQPPTSLASQCGSPEEDMSQGN